MKARIRPLAPCALVWNYSETEPGFAALADACRAEGLPLIPVSPADTGRTISSLCGGPGPASAPALAGDWPAALIMNGLDRARLDGFLTRLRAGGVSHPHEGDGHPHQPELDSGRSAGRACAGTGCLCRPCRSMNMHKKRNKAIFYAKSADLYSFCNQTVIFYSALLH